MARERKDENVIVPENLSTSVDRAGIKPYGENPDLTQGGEASPKAFWRNLTRFGYESPRQEYVESVETPSMRELAQKWSVKQQTLSKWKHAQKWDDERVRFWRDVFTRQNQLLKGDIAAVRASTLSSQVAFWRRMAGALESMASRGYIEEISPTGGLRQRDFGPKDLKDMAAVGEKIWDGLNAAVGFTQGMLKEIEEEDETGGKTKSITEVVYRVTKTEVKDEPKNEPRIIESESEVKSIPSREEKPLDADTKEAGNQS